MHVGLSELLDRSNDLDAADRHLQASADLGEHAGAAAAPLPLAGRPGPPLQLDGDDSTGRWTCSTRPKRSTTPTSRRRSAHVRRSRHGPDRTAGATSPKPEPLGDGPRPHRRRRPQLPRRSTNTSPWPGCSWPRRHHDPAGSALDEALSLLERLLAAAEDGRRVGSAIEILALRALAHDAAGATSTALAASGGRAGPSGTGRLCPGLPRRGSADGRPPADRSAVTARPPSRPADSSPPAGPPRRASPSVPAEPAVPVLVDELSSRELEVLRLLRSDLSGPDLARELHGVPQHPADPHQEHLREARREQPTRRRPPSGRTRPVAAPLRRPRCAPVAARSVLLMIATPITTW